MWCALGCCLPPVTPKWPGLLRTPAQPSPALPCLLSPTTNIQLPQNVFTWMSYRYPKLVVQSLSHVQLFATSWIAARQASLPFTISWSLLKLMSIELVMAFNHLVLCCPLLLLCQPFPASESFPMCQLFASGGQNI